MHKEIHVHRAADWFESELQPLSQAEWESYLVAHPDLALADDGTANWIEHPSGRPVTIRFEDGRIVAANLDVPTRVRLGRIAEALGAMVQGDDCELYGPGGEELANDAPDQTVLTVYDEVADDGHGPLFDPRRATSRGEFLRGLLRRD